MAERDVIEVEEDKILYKDTLYISDSKETNLFAAAIILGFVFGVLLTLAIQYILLTL